MTKEDATLLGPNNAAIRLKLQLYGYVMVIRVDLTITAPLGTAKSRSMVMVPPLFRLQVHDIGAAPAVQPGADAGGGTEMPAPCI